MRFKQNGKANTPEKVTWYVSLYTCTGFIMISIDREITGCKAMETENCSFLMYIDANW